MVFVFMYVDVVEGAIMQLDAEGTLELGGGRQLVSATRCEYWIFRARVPLLPARVLSLFLPLPFSP